MQKLIGTLLIFAVLIIGIVFILLYVAFGGGTYYGHLGYCANVKLQCYMAINICSLSTSLLLILYNIYTSTFQKLENQQSIFSISILFGFALLLFSVIYIFNYPYVDREFGFISQSGKHEGISNELSIWSVSLAIVLAFSVRHLKPYLSKRKYLFSFVFIVACCLVILLVYLFSKYEYCYG